VEKKTKFRLPLKLSLLRASRPKSARGMQPPTVGAGPNFIQIGSH